MTSIEDQIAALVPSITEQVAAQIRERAIKNLEYVVAEAVTEEVKKYVAEVIVPLAAAELVNNQDAIKNSVVAAVKLVGEQMGAALVKQVAEKLNGYQGDKFLKDIFGPLFRGY